MARTVSAVAAVHVNWASSPAIRKLILKLRFGKLCFWAKMV